MSVKVHGVDLERTYGLFLTDESTFNPPAVKSYLLDLPGGNGSLDVTEAFGDVLYEAREDTLVFSVDAPPTEWSKVKTRVADFLHGQAYDYTLDSDPGYTYHGRFEVDQFYQQGCYQKMQIRVVSNPYKSAGWRTYTVDAQAGANVVLNPGRGRVRPIFESRMPTHVIANGIDALLPAGSHTAVGLTIHDGASSVYVDTGGSIRGGTTTWSDLAAKTWGALAGKHYNDLKWTAGPPLPSPSYEVKIAYEVLEL